MSPRPCEYYTTISRPGSDVTRPGSNPPQRDTHLQRAAHPCPDRVRFSIEEDRPVHTCGPKPAGGLL